MHLTFSSVSICFAYQDHLWSPLQFSPSWAPSLRSQGLSSQQNRSHFRHLQTGEIWCKKILSMMIEIGINERLLSSQGWRDKESSSALGNRVRRPLPSPHSHSSALQFPSGYTLLKASWPGSLRKQLEGSAPWNTDWIRVRRNGFQEKQVPNSATFLYTPTLELLIELLASLPILPCIIWNISWEYLGLIVHLTGEKGRERVTCSQPHLYALTSHFYHPQAGPQCSSGGVILKDLKSKSISVRQQREKEGENYSLLSFLLIPPHASPFLFFFFF